MEEFPVIMIRKGKIIVGERILKKKKEKIELIDNLIREKKMVYIIDIDGKERGSPNLKFYNLIEGKIWVDAFPRDLNDIVDLLICGVEKMTIRFFEEKYLEEIKNISENDFFIFENLEIARRYGFAGIVTEKDFSCNDDIQIWKICKDNGIIRRIK